MSFSFYVTAYAPPSARQLIQQVDDHGDLRVAEEIQDGPWEEGFAYHLHREGVSTRGVELCWESDQLQVRLLTLASPEDWELAFRVLEAAAGDDEVRGENGESAPGGRVREVFTDLCQLSNEGGTAFLVDRIQSEEAVLTLPGPARAFCIGPRLLAELEAAGERDELTQRILAKIREVQYTREARDFYCASVLQASVDDELAFTLTAFGPGVRYLLPEVQFVALVTEDDEELFLDHDSFLELLAGWARFLDERQVFVEPLSGPNWERFLAAARACAVEPLAFVKGEVEREVLTARAREQGAKLSESLEPHEPGPEDPAELDRAIELLRDARERRPDDLGILDDLATAYAQRAQARLGRGEQEQALRDQDQAIRFQAKLARRDSSRRPELALAWARRSDLSANADAPRDALADLDRAAQILEDCLEGGPREVALNLVAARCRQAELASRLGEDDDAADALAAAEALCAQRDEPEAWARLLRIRARLRQGRDPAAAMLDLARAFDLHERVAKEDPDECSGFFDLAEELWEERLRQLDIPGASGVVERALALLERELAAGRARPSWTSRVFAARRTFLGAERRYPEAFEAAERGLRETQSLARPGDEGWVARSYTELASAREDTGDLRGAGEAYAHAMAAFGRAPDARPSELLRTRVLWAGVLNDLGQPDQARLELERAERLLPEEDERDSSSCWMRAGWLHAHAHAARLLEELPLSRELIRRAEALLSQVVEPTSFGEGFLAVVRCERAQISLALGEDDDARDAAQSALEVLQAHAQRGLHFGAPMSCDAELVLARLDLRDGELPRAMERLDRSLREIGEDPPRRARLERARGEVLLALGESDQAGAALLAAGRAAGGHLPELLRVATDAVRLDLLGEELSEVLEEHAGVLPARPSQHLHAQAARLADALVGSKALPRLREWVVTSLD